MKNSLFMALGLILISLLAGCADFTSRNEYRQTQEAEARNETREARETEIWSELFHPPSDDAKPTKAPKFSEPILVSQKKWEASKISSYHVIISFSEGLENQRTEREVVVENGSILTSSCLIDECSATTFEDVYTIENLFKVAKGSTLAYATAIPGYFTLVYDECVQELSFDETYGFPEFMNIDCPEAVGEEHSFRVILFETIQ